MSEAATLDAPAAAAPTLLAQPAQDTTNPTPGTTDAPDAQHAASGDGAQPGDAAATPDAKGDGSEAAGDKPAEDKAPERVAPEKYEFKPPEGTTLDAEVLAEFEGVARELGMPQAEAQALVDKLAPKIAARTAATVQAQQAQQVAQISEQWASAVQADKEIGGDALPLTLAAARRALDAYGSTELRALLEDSRLGNHPEVIRFLARAGKAAGEDTNLIGGKAPAAGSAAQSLYAKSNMNP